MLGLPPRMWLTIAGASALMGLVATTQLYTGMAWLGWNQGRAPVSLGRLLLWQEAMWLTWTIATPIVIWLARRYPPRAAAGVLLLHLSAGFVVAVLRVTAVESLSGWLAPFSEGGQLPSFPQRLAARFTGSVQGELLIYAAILGAVHASDNARRVRDREARAAALEAQLAHAQLDSLRVQLQPHFLFNTLHTVGALIREREVASALETLEHLGQLLRRSLATIEQDLTPLREELDVLRLYSQIQTTRFLDTLRIDVDVDDDILDAPVPSLLLQPLVENAIRHGVSRVERAGEVVVRGYAAGGRILLHVLDNGAGLAQPSASTTTGVGLSNTRARLSLLYGADFDFTIAARQPFGVEVIVSLPRPRAGAAPSAA